MPLNAKRPGIKRLVLATVCLAALGACSPIIHTHGYTPRATELENVRVGVDTRESVVQRLGRPSTVGSFDADEWFYISMRTETIAFFEPEVVEQTVVTVSFDENGIVNEVGRYGLEDGRVIDLVTRETPSSGRKLTLLQQMFQNLGRYNGGSNLIDRISRGSPGG